MGIGLTVTKLIMAELGGSFKIENNYRNEFFNSPDDVDPDINLITNLS